MPETHIAQLKKLILQNEKALAELKKTLQDIDQRRSTSEGKHGKKTVNAARSQSANDRVPEH